MLSLHLAKLSSEPEIVNFGELLTFQNSREKALD
jgi:hypothetical protein